MRSRCKPCPCRCIPSEMHRFLIALPCPSSPPGAGNRVLDLGLQRSPPTSEVHTVSPCEQGEHRRPQGTTGDGGPSSRGMHRSTQAATSSSPVAPKTKWAGHPFWQRRPPLKPP